MTRTTADIVVIGSGVIGLTTTLALADAGLDVVLLADVRQGEASPAAAGMLAPGVEAGDAAVRALHTTARDRWVPYAAMLAERSGVPVPVDRRGVLQLALDDEAAAALVARAPGGAQWLDQSSLAALEPALVHAVGALHHPHDGAVNPLVVLRALRAIVGRHVHVRVVSDAATAVAIGPTGEAVTVMLRSGESLSAMRVVVATGAWTTALEGLPRALPIEPVRGQLMSVASKALQHVVYGGGGYVVPRGDGRTLIGSTMERVGFPEPGATPEGVATLRRIGAAVFSKLETAPMLHAWAGLRPMTPDALPILGPDPAAPALLWATGHSRNGVLLAPLSADIVASTVTGSPAPIDPAPFAADRFSAR